MQQEGATVRPSPSSWVVCSSTSLLRRSTSVNSLDAGEGPGSRTNHQEGGSAAAAPPTGHSGGEAGWQQEGKGNRDPVTRWGRELPGCVNGQRRMHGGGKGREGNTRDTRAAIRGKGGRDPRLVVSFESGPILRV